MIDQKRARVSYLFWIYTLLVIAWGAWVRISHSGNGCGDHWPLCHGAVIPNLEDKKTFVEFTHRIMSGAYGLLVFWIFYDILKNISSKQIRKIGWFLLVFMIIEALLGALLVKKSLVTVNDSVFRLVTMSFHQLNSFLLAGTAFILYLSYTAKVSIRITKLNIVLLAIAVTGAIASLAATLFPSSSLWEGIINDFTNDSHLFVKLRIIHPLLASLSVTAIIYWLMTQSRNPHAPKMALKLFLAASIGVITLVTLSPTWLKIAHLMIAHYIWAEVLRYQLVGQHQSV